MNNIKTIKSFSEVNWTQFTQDHLMAFDLDDTLFLQTNRGMRNINVEYRNKLINKLREIGGEELVTKMFDQLEYQLTEPNLIDIINDLTNKNIETIGFTVRRTGLPNSTTIETVEYKTTNVLKKLNINLTPKQLLDCVLTDTNGLLLPDLVLDKKLQPFDSTTQALITNGVLFTNGLIKSYVLGKVFDKYKYFPKIFVFFDDKMYNHTDIMKEIELINKQYDTNIEYQGYLYTGAIELYDNSIDETRLDEQVDNFVKTGILSD